MFRPLRRIKQALPPEECAAILRTQKRGVLSVLGDDGYPYGLPINYVYDESEQALYFHCALSGHKADAINTCDKASFCVLDEGKKEDGEWFYRFRSVIVFGRIAFVESEEEKRAVCNALCEKFGQGKDYQDAEWQKYAKNVACLRLKAEHITGKAVKEE